MLFSCSIRDNIAYGADDPEAVTTEEIYAAAREANAYNFVKSFPQGFDTVVGEKGVLLSGQNELTTRSVLLSLQSIAGFAGYNCFIPFHLGNMPKSLFQGFLIHTLITQAKQSRHNQTSVVFVVAGYKEVQ